MKSEKFLLLESLVGANSDLNGLVAYAEDSVVSKTLIDKKTGTITIFAFDAGQGLSEHTSPYDAFVQIVDGKARIRIDQNEIQAEAGQIVVMPSNIPHALFADEKFKMLLTLIR